MIIKDLVVCDCPKCGAIAEEWKCNLFKCVICGCIFKGN